MWSDDGLIEGSSNSCHLQERRTRRPEELEANYDYELRLPDLYMSDGKNLPTDELATRNLC
jgi:hypothetical protein